jgi:NitT/TauT family transport system substrate-binding protein
MEPGRRRDKIQTTNDTFMMETTSRPRGGLLKSLLFGLAAMVLMLASCSGEPPAPASRIDTVRLVGTIGPLSIPLAYMVEHNSMSSVANKTTLEIWANPTQLQAIVSGGQGDFVSLPTNSAAMFYNKGVSLQLLDSSVWNILYLVTPDTSVKSVQDLKGKRVVVPYQGAVPDGIFQAVLKRQGLDPAKDIDIFYAPDPVQASQFLVSGQEKYSLLSEPSATSVILKARASGKTLVRALNMQTEWRKGTGDSSSTPIAGTVVLGAMKDRPDIVKVFSSEYQKAVKWMLANPEEAGKIGARVLAEQGFTAEVLTESMQNIDWRFVTAADTRSDLEAFFGALAQVSPNFIGGKVPDGGFYGAK